MIRVVGFVDTLPAAAAYHGKFKDQFETAEGAGVSGMTDLSDWKTARNLIARVQALVPAETDVVSTAVFALEPGHVQPWGQGAEDGCDRFVVALHTGPGAMLTVGPHTLPFVVGQVLHFNPRNLHTVANFGPVPLVALAVDLRCPPHSS